MNANAQSDAERQRRNRRPDYIVKVVKIISLVLGIVGVGGAVYNNHSQIQNISGDVMNNDTLQKEQFNRLNSRIEHINGRLDALEKWMQSLNVSMDSRIDAHVQ